MAKSQYKLLNPEKLYENPYSDAVNMCVELVQIAFMGLS